MKLNQIEIVQLFSKAIDNAFSLFNAAQHLMTDYSGKKHPSLGLAELSLEELGKSFTCLAYYSNAEKISDWKIFWKEWKDHNLKAHRAFFYEFFCLLRVELNSQIYKDSFPSIRDSISREKEHSFYVDIYKSNRKIYIPELEVTDDECSNRLLSLLGLLNSAFHVRDWMISEESDQFSAPDINFTTKLKISIPPF
jgi:AbiV family abortive infection protein